MVYTVLEQLLQPQQPNQQQGAGHRPGITWAQAAILQFRSRRQVTLTLVTIMLLLLCGVIIRAASWHKKPAEMQ